MARKFKRAAKSCLLIVYPAGSGSLKEEKSCKLIFICQGQEVLKKVKELFIVCSSDRAGKLKRKDKSCLLFVYQAGPRSLKESLKIVNCLFIQQGQEV